MNADIRLIIYCSRNNILLDVYKKKDARITRHKHSTKE